GGHRPRAACQLLRRPRRARRGAAADRRAAGMAGGRRRLRAGVRSVAGGKSRQPAARGRPARHARARRQGRRPARGLGTKMSAPETWTVRALLAWARDWLQRKGVDSPRLDADLLLASALGCDRVRLYIDADKPLSPEELARFKPLIQRRASREPVAYILGIKEFYGRSFQIRSGVFIPRPETELLVQLVLGSLARGQPAQVLDLCTGSGAVGISIAAERPQAQVDLVELSPAAV